MPGLRQAWRRYPAGLSAGSHGHRLSRIAQLDCPSRPMAALGRSGRAAPEEEVTLMDQRRSASGFWLRLAQFTWQMLGNSPSACRMMAIGYVLHRRLAKWR